MTVRLRRCDTIEAFWPLAEPFLLRREAEHNIILGLSAALLRRGQESGAYMATVDDGDAIIAAALRTDPEHEVLLSYDPPPDAVALIVDDLYQFDPWLVGVTADAADALAFVQAWAHTSGQQFRRITAMRLYKLDAVHPPQQPPTGYARVAAAEDRDLLIAWTTSFYNEALGEEARAAEIVDQLLASDPAERGLCVWIDGGQVVSMAVYTGPTQNGMRVAMVYTPPELRGRGYASACTAAVSQIVLDRGKQFCFLYTDQLNPTSNHIYQQIGYVPVSDVDRYRFHDRADKDKA